MKTSTKVLIAVIAVILVGVIVGVVVYASTGLREKTFNDLVNDINNQSVTEIYLSNDTAYVKTESSGNNYEYRVYARYELVVNAVNDYKKSAEVTAEKSYDDFIKDLNKGKVAEIYFKDGVAYVRIAPRASGYDYKIYVSESVIKDDVRKYKDTAETDLTLTYTDNYAVKDIVLMFNDRYATSITDYIIPILGLVMLIVLMVFMFRAMNNTTKSTMDFGKTKTNAQNQLKVRFSDVAGAEEEKEELKEIVEFLKNPQKFTAVGARVPHGVLLVGPPGTGKTLFAKAVAGEANVPFFSKSGSDFVEMFVGVGASRVRDLFDQAKKNMPCIVFIDEIDAVGRQRGAGMGGGNDEREQTLNQLLVAMDGFESNEHIIVMAATNRSDVLDPALMRPGRFDRQIYVNLPDVRGREAIFKVHSRNKPLASDIDFQILARITSGFSGADIENMLNEAAILCARDNRTRLTMEDMYEALDKVEMGPAKKSRLVTPFDQRITAYHEAGHAIVACKTKGCMPVHEVTIIPRGNAGGYTMFRPDNDNTHVPVSQLLGKLASVMGGRAAEELIIEDYTAGASGDIQQATRIARKMVTEWGMSKKIGNVYYGGSQEVFLGRDYQTQNSYSEAVATDIDAEVKRLIEEGHAQAVKCLSENRQLLDNMARVLIECETIYAEEVEMLINGASPEEVKAALNARLSNKNANRDALEKAPIQQLSDIQPITKSEKPSADEIFSADNGNKDRSATVEEQKPSMEDVPAADGKEQTAQTEGQSEQGEEQKPEKAEDIKPATVTKKPIKRAKKSEKTDEANADSAEKQDKDDKKDE